MNILKLFKRTKPEIGPNQKLWFSYLHSGFYPQAREKLEGPQGFCCLGVACVAAENNGIHVYRSKLDNKIDGHLITQQMSTMKWLGLREKGPGKKFSFWYGFKKYTVHSDHIGIAKLNDRDKFSFSQIADIIEKHADKFFVEPK